MKVLSPNDCEQVADILKRRANEVASYSDQNRDKMPGSVVMALSREIQRLRALQAKIEPPKETPEDEGETGDMGT